MNNGNKKILYVWKGPYPWEIRIKKFCYTLTNADYDVFVLARHTGENKKCEIVDNVNIIRVGKKAGFHTLPVPKNLIWRNAIKRAIKEIQPDLIIVREIMLAEDTALLGKKHSIPVIMDMAENYPACMKIWKKYNSNMLSRFLMHNLKIPDIVEKRSVKLCDGIIVVCDEQIERLKNYYKFSSSKIGVVHNTPNISYFNDARHFSSESPKVLCHHGFLSAEKSIKNLLLGFEIAANNKNIELIIAGNGESENEYKELVAKFRNKDKISFLGSYNYKNLPQILGKADIGVIPYQINDFNNYTIHNKIFDYFALGKPVLTSTANPLVRIINETKAGLSLDFSTPEAAANAIKTMLLSDTENMSNNAISWAKNKYNWDVDSKVLINFIEKYL